MTSLVAWVGVDSRGPYSVYFASDSRISWDGGQVWDYGRKLFASSKYPDIFGYCGDVLFPSQVLGRIVNMIDAGLLFSVEDSPNLKHEIISKTLTKSFEGYPQSSVANNSFKIIYCTRMNAEMRSKFFVSQLSWSLKSGWEEEWLDIPKESGIICAFGSGAPSIHKWYSRWNNTQDKRTSRIVFSGFCNALQSFEDKFTGGAPQLVGVYRKGEGKTFGIIHKNERYILGLPVVESETLSSVHWHNEVFERCDWQTKKPLEDAQPHRRFHGLTKL